jgi:hypothetical protein
LNLSTLHRAEDFPAGHRLPGAKALQRMGGKHGPKQIG